MQEPRAILARIPQSQFISTGLRLYQEPCPGGCDPAHAGHSREVTLRESYLDAICGIEAELAGSSPLNQR